jgi:MoxR-like ATPase
MLEARHVDGDAPRRGPDTMSDRRVLRARIAARVVGREEELELVLAAVATGRDLVLEGPPGTSKTTLLRAITEVWEIPLVLVEGNAELTPGRLLGHHDPARVLQEGYTPGTFVAGPLVRAMRDGGFLHFEEFNRAPEDTLNALLTAIADREVTIPRVGTICAAPTFRVVASMNPFDNVGTTRLSTSIRDRLCRFAIGYQDEAAEQAIVTLRGGTAALAPSAPRIVADAVAVTRMTRRHEAVRQGSSVRGAIDLFLLAAELSTVREVEDGDHERYRQTFYEAMMLALSGRLLLDEAVDTDAATVLREIWEAWFSLDPASTQPG